MSETFPSHEAHEEGNVAHATLCVQSLIDEVFRSLAACRTLREVSSNLDDCSVEIDAASKCTDEFPATVRASSRRSKT